MLKLIGTLLIIGSWFGVMVLSHDVFPSAFQTKSGICNDVTNPCTDPDYLYCAPSLFFGFFKLQIYLCHKCMCDVSPDQCFFENLHTKCDCTDYMASGLYCEDPFCGSSPCVFGTCISDSCVCDSDYFGASCDQQYLPCDSSPCDTTGTMSCIDGVGMNAYTCDCNADYFGVLCADQYLPCDSSPCDTTGTMSCIDGVGMNAYTCDCNADYFGVLCADQYLPCACSPCFSIGTMSCDDGVGPDGYTCNCNADYFGNACQNQYNPCDDPSICGDGSCNDGVGEGEYSCTCDASFDCQFCG